MIDHPVEYLSTRGAADFLRLSPRTLEAYRVNGTGPAFHRFGGVVRYRRSDLDEWAAARRAPRLPDSDLLPPL